MEDQNGDMQERPQGIVIGEDGNVRDAHTSDYATGSLIFEPPDGNAPGYFKRERVMVRYMEGWRTNTITAAQVDDLIQILLSCVVQPADREMALAELEELSRDQIRKLTQLMLTGGSNVTIPLQKPRPLTRGSKAAGRGRRGGRR